MSIPPRGISHQKNRSFSFKSLLIFFWNIFKAFYYCIERVVLVILIIGSTVGLAWWLSQKPSLLRDWEPQDAILPNISWSGDTIVTIKNIRNHQWSSDTVFSSSYYDDTFDISQIETVYYSIIPFSEKDGPAHTMLSFSFSGGKNIVISAELRKERGESFDVLKGILNQFEIQYVIASENDVIKLRTNYRKNQVFMYPIDTPREKMLSLFRSMLIRADKLTKEPEFYNTIWNNCTTSILDHANSLRKEKINGGLFTLLPAHSDELVYQAGLIQTKLSLPDARKYYRVDEIARTFTGSSRDFSDIIRKPIQ